MREISLHILDIMQNSIAAEASRIIVTVVSDSIKDTLKIGIDDNGKGMNPDFLKKVMDPFVTTRTTRKIGLGIPMLAAASELCGGHFHMQSEEGKGTSVAASFRLRHIDRAPFGDITSTIITVISANPDRSFRYEQTVDGRQFTVDTDEIKQQLDNVPINDLHVIKWLRDYIKEGLSEIGEID